ncbi:MAG: hypothetical protein D6677_13745 [Calditrichaeota bacterium]|nr:MAG: hypothetical protein D6677_13745 [Calditrichota bacterium]
MEENFYHHLFRFYARTLMFPYDEMGQELQYLFRQMEKQAIEPIEAQLSGRALEVINFYQGEEMSALQAEYGRLFSIKENERPLVDIHFLPYTTPARGEAFLDRIYESDLQVAFDEAPESMLNFIGFFAFDADSLTDPEQRKLFVEIVNGFSSALSDKTILNFYKEISRGLNELAVVLTD